MAGAVTTANTSDNDVKISRVVCLSFANKRAMLGDYMRQCRRSSEVGLPQRNAFCTPYHKEGSLDSHALAHQIVDLVEEKQATDIVLLDIREQTSIADYFVIATVDNERQAKAIEDDLLQTLRLQQNIRPLGIEGVESRTGGWALLDYGDVIVHLFTEESREHYKLEELWNKAAVVVKVL